MNELWTYLQNIDYLVIIDILLIGAVLGVSVAFFRDKRSKKLVLLMSVTALYVVIAVANAFWSSNALNISLVIRNNYLYVYVAEHRYSLSV
jgi:phosphoglycerol transferase MdoB-like AlkP superfamily enzyme